MDDLLIKYLLGEATPEEAARVERWLAQDAGHRERFEQFSSVLELSRQTAREDAVASGPIPAWRRPAPGTTPGGSTASVRWPRLAAVMIGILLLAAGGYWVLKPHRPDIRRLPGTAVSPPAKSTSMPTRPAVTPSPASRLATARPEEEGERLLSGSRPMTARFPDGTLVTLNRGASVKIAGEADSQEFSVQLKGEAFFTVPHHPSRPFIVQAGALTITVLGTSFEVNQRGDSIELVVETGAVRAGDRMIVHAGERLAINGRGKWIKTRNMDRLYGYYLGRPLICDSIPLGRLIEVLDRTTDTPIVLGRKDLAGLPLTAEFRGESPGRIAAIVALTFNLSVTRQGRAIILQ